MAVLQKYFPNSFFSKFFPLQLEIILMKLNSSQKIIYKYFIFTCLEVTSISIQIIFLISE